jgi:hypothetical protein
MFSGPPLPLPADLPLRALLAQAQQPGTLGAWVSESTCALHLYEADGGATSRLLVSPDLGFLLGRCSRIALREGQRTIVLDAEAIVQWRTLQVITSSPYLPGLERLAILFPGLLLDLGGFSVRLENHPADAVLMECLAQDVTVKESRIVYRVDESNLQ